MKNKILFLLCLIITSCTNNNIGGTDGKHFASSTDTVQLINEINKERREINSKAAVYDKVEKDVFGKSTEGGVVTAFYDNKVFKKVITTFYGEMGKTVTEYYFNKDGLSFVFNVKYLYDKPIYEKGSKIVSTQENRYYFLNNQLIKWLDNKGKSVNLSSREYQKEQKNLLEDVEEIKQKLGDYRSNEK